MKKYCIRLEMWGLNDLGHSVSDSVCYISVRLEWRALLLTNPLCTGSMTVQIGAYQVVEDYSFPTSLLLQHRKPSHTRNISCCSLTCFSLTCESRSYWCRYNQFWRGTSRRAISWRGPLKHLLCTRSMRILRQQPRSRCSRNVNHQECDC